VTLHNWIMLHNFYDLVASVKSHQMKDEEHTGHYPVDFYSVSILLLLFLNVWCVCACLDKSKVNSYFSPFQYP
jgi:hypothetical protein